MLERRGRRRMHENVDRTRSGSQTPPLKPRSSTRRGLFRPKDPFARDVCPACVSMRAAPASRAIGWPRCRRHRHRRSTALRSAALRRLSQDDRADGGVCHNCVPPQWPAAKDQVGYSPWVAGEAADPLRTSDEIALDESVLDRVRATDVLIYDAAS